MKIEIKTDNAAFGDAPSEVARILRHLAEHVSRWGMPSRGVVVQLFDSNGNTVGTATSDKQDLDAD